MGCGIESEQYGASPQSGRGGDAAEHADAGTGLPRSTAKRAASDGTDIADEAADAHDPAHQKSEEEHGANLDWHPVAGWTELDPPVIVTGP